MKTSSTRLVMLAALLGGLTLGPPVSAQEHRATQTTLSAAVTATAGRITVASATTFAATAKVWVSQELMEVISVSGTTITVRRGVEGTRATAHPNSARVTVAMNAAGQEHFYAYDPDVTESCTRGSGQARVAPWVNIRTGVVWVCWASGVWNGTHVSQIAYDSNQGSE